MPRNVNVAGTGFPARLAALRSQAGLTKTELAEKAGISFRTIHNYESGQSTRVQEKTLRLLAAALGVSYEYLLTGTEPALPGGVAAASEPAPAVRDAARRSRRSRMLPIVSTIIIFVIAAGYWGLHAARVHSAVVEVDGHHITARDGLLKWTLWEHHYRSAVQAWDVVDLAGHHDVVYGLYGGYSDSGRLLACDLADGHVEWESTPDMAEAERAFGNIVGESGGFGVDRIVTGDIDGDGAPEVIVTYGHIKWYPACVSIYRADGKRVASYYNGGHIYDIHVADIDGDGRDEILLGATNNGKRYQGASVILLDGKCCHGASTDSLMMADSQLPDSCAIRVILPQFDPPFMTLLGGTRGSSRLRAVRIKTYAAPSGEMRIQFDVCIDDPSLVVVTDAELHPLRVDVSDALLTVMNGWPPGDQQRFVDGLNAWLASGYRYGARR